MANSQLQLRFTSPVAPLIERFIQEKRACGYRYRTGAAELARFDRFLFGEGLTQCELPRSLVRKWLTKQPHETAANHQARVCTARRFAVFMVREGYAADVPGPSLTAKGCTGFSPRILTHAEVKRLLDAADQLKPDAHGPLRHLVMPEVFRLLYGCGLRVSEVLQLRVSDVDFNRGVLQVREAKFGKDRFVPPAIALVQRLKRFAALFGVRPANDYFFPTLHGGAWSIGTIYHIYRELLLRCGITHGGRGNGPRLHDLRHTMAVHTLLRWYREGVDLDAKLPVLATYLGHQSVTGTQRYLHLTAELFPEITIRANAAFGDVIPRRIAS